MDWLVGILLLTVGAIIGFFVAKYFNDKEIGNKNNDEKEQTVKELMTQQATQHLHLTKNVAQQLSSQCDALKQQISDYEQLIISQSAGTEDNSLNYFGEHATTYLRNKSSATKNNLSSSDIQPLDFASHSSGLFSGNQEAIEKESK